MPSLFLLLLAALVLTLAPHRRNHYQVVAQQHDSALPEEQSETSNDQNDFVSCKQGPDGTIACTTKRNEEQGQISCSRRESDESLVCELVIQQPDDWNNVKLTLEDCPEGHSHCFRADISTFVPPEQQSTNQDDSSVKPSDDTDTTGALERLGQTVQYQQHVVNERGEVQIGSLWYSPPMEAKYGGKISRLLEERVDSSPSEWTVGDDADWYQRLGMAHFDVLEQTISGASSFLRSSGASFYGISTTGMGVAGDEEDETDKPTDADDSETEEKNRVHVQYAINAFQQAAQIYEGVRQDYPAEQMKAAELLASVYFHMGEAFGLSMDTQQAALARDYFVQADVLFRQVIEHDDSGKPDPVFYRSPAQKLDTKISWAHCCLRLGVSLLSTPLEEQQAVTLDLHDVDLEELMQNPEMANEILGESLSVLGLDKLAENAEKASTLFESARVVFKEALRQRDFGGKDSETISLKRHLGTTLHNLGTAAFAQGLSKEGCDYCEGAHNEYLDIFKMVSPTSADGRDNIQAIAEVQQTLADNYLQQGNYKRAKSSYAAAMHWFEEYSLEPPPNNVYMIQGDETLQQYERALEEYNDVVNGNLGSDNGLYQPDYLEYAQDEHYAYGRDDGYEGDLHAGLGAAYLGMGDVFQAASHLQLAIQLYQRSSKGGQEDQAVADAKFNLAMVHFRTGAFRESAEVYGQALDIYRRVVGEGVNPLAQGGLDLASLQQAAKASVKQDQDASAEGKKDSQTAGSGKLEFDPSSNDHAANLVAAALAAATEKKLQAAQHEPEGSTPPVGPKIDLESFRRTLGDNATVTDATKGQEK